MPGSIVLRRREQVLYLVVGGWNTVFGYGVWAFLQYLLGEHLHYLVIVLLSWLIAVANAYLGYRYVVFRSRGPILRELPRFSLVYVLTLLANLALLPVALNVLPFNIYVCLNGRQRLARQMVQAGLRYKQRDNCFVDISDFARAQALLDTQRDHDLWYLPYVVPQFVGFVVFMLAGTAETARAPFDLPEAEQELVAGYHTEYGGMRFGLFTMSEYVNLITLSGLCVTLFLGGWHGFGWDGPSWLTPLWFLLKLVLLLYVFIWMRTTLPRLRYDQLMRFGWKILLPLATLNAIVTAVLVVWL